MKKLCFLLLFGAAACTQQPTDHFILRGTVPGVMDSTKVTLRTVTRWDKDLASAYVIDGKFELRGQLDAPTLCKLSLNNARSYELDFFVENGKLTFTTPACSVSSLRKTLSLIPDICNGILTIPSVSPFLMPNNLRSLFVSVMMLACISGRTSIFT